MAKQIKKYSKTALILSLILMMVGVYAAILPAQAGDLDNRKVTVDDSTPGGTGVDYAFVADFTGTPKCIEVVFSAAAVSAGLSSTSAVSGADADWSTFTKATWADIDNSAQGTVQFWDATGEAGGNAAGFGIGTITNPSAGVYTAAINTYAPGSCSDAATCCTGATTDTGTVAFAIVAGVTVSVTVTESLSVTVAAASPMDCIDGGNVSITSGITATAVPFGSTSGNSFIDGCQQITIGTNASNGYVATVQEDDQLTFVANEIPDGTCDSSSCDYNSAGGWATNTNNGFGYCMEDMTGTAAATADATGWADGKQCDQVGGNFKTFANISDAETAQKIMEKTTATAGTSDVCEIGFRISVSPGQTAGAYENEIAYIVTPKY